MTTLIHADIFFFVTTIVVILIAIVCIVLLIYAILSLRTIFRISKAIENETKKVIDDVEKLRTGFKGHHANFKTKWASIKRFFRTLLPSRKPPTQ